MRFREQVLSSRVPVFGIASWMDAGTADAALRPCLTYPGPQWVMIGAWNRGGVNQSSPYLEEKAPLSPTPAVLRQEVLRFLDASLGDPDSEPRNEVTLYTLGSETWQRFSQWPPLGVWKQPWYFGAERPGSLGEAALPKWVPTATRSISSHTSGVYNRWSGSWG